MITGLVRENQLSGEAEAVRAQQGRRNINEGIMQVLSFLVVDKGRELRSKVSSVSRRLFTQKKNWFPNNLGRRLNHLRSLSDEPLD
jgi:hypothetical protein